ncbi:MAG: AEC family transporter [Pseudomonadota bacterium]
MSDLLTVILPVFALIFAGYAAARTKLIGPDGAKGLNDFVLYFCVPPLLFRTMQTVSLDAGSTLRVWGVYYSAVAVIWVIVALAARRVPGLGAAGGAGTAFAATFGNLGMIGLSIAYLAFGDEGLVIAALIIAIHSANHWFFCTLWAEFALRRQGVSPGAVAASVVMTLLKNPIVLALMFGAAWNAGGLTMPAVGERLIALAGDAAIPTGLFALGLAVAAYPMRGNLTAISTLIGLKMLVFPLTAWALAVFVFALPPRETGLVALFAALPTGMNAYFFSLKFDAGVPAVTGAIAVGILLSAISIPLVLHLAGV